MTYNTITPPELAARLAGHEHEDAAQKLVLIDVREVEEYEIARIEAATLLPLSRFDEWVTMLDPSEEFVFMCHHGIRSAQVCRFLSAQGFAKLHNLAGGIDRWSAEVDPNVATY